MRTIKFGLIGLGLISKRFATVLSGMNGVEISCVASRDIKRSDDFAKEFHVKKAVPTYQQVIDDPDVDVVYIGLTHNLHYDYTKKCLEQHKAVLCEKPLVTTEKEARELVDLAKKNQTFLMEALWTRCMPAFQKARQWVKKGKIGEVKLITANFCYHAAFDPNHRIYSKETAGGSLFDVGIYAMDFAMGILNAQPEKVTGLAVIAPNGVDESAAFSMRFNGGILANLTCGFNVRAMEEAMIYGTDGRIIVENCFGPQSCTLYDEKRNLLESFSEPVPDGFIYQIQHCAELIRKGKIESDLIPWKDTIASAAVFDELMSQWKIVR